MIDTHSHLWFQHFDTDREAVIQRAKKAGITAMIQVGCDEESSRQAVELAKNYDALFATIGLHPNEHQLWKHGKALDWMRELLKDSEKIVGIGETGIDYYRSSDHSKLQIQMLRGQCELALEYQLPVVIHLRMTKRPEMDDGALNSAEKDVLMVLDDLKMPKDRVVFHCYSGGLQMAEKILEKGWVISFSGVVTYPNSGELREVVQMVPGDQFLVETDCPFLSPQKYRGQRNEPLFVTETALTIAQARGVTLEEIEHQTDANAQRIFAFL